MNRVEGITLDRRGLRQADAISTGTAAKFITGLDDDCEASEFAYAIADTVELVSPMVDQVCDKVAKGIVCKK